MKSERRHDLKTNVLARKMEELPDLGRQYANKILLGVIVVLLVIFLVRYRAQQAEEARINASTSLSIAQQTIHELWYQPVMLLGDQPGMAMKRDELAKEAESALDNAMRTAEDPKMRAEIYVARGDLNWQLANFPALPAAATQPSLALPKSSGDYLTAASSAYSEVLNEPLSQNHVALTAARLGLAAIAENKVDWSSAERNYNEVIGDSQTDPTMKTYAERRLKMLDDLKKPVLLAGAAHEAAPSPLDFAPTFGPPAPTTTHAPTTDFSPFNLISSHSPAAGPTTTATTRPAISH